MVSQESMTVPQDAVTVSQESAIAPSDRRLRSRETENLPGKVNHLTESIGELHFKHSLRHPVTIHIFRKCRFGYMYALSSSQGRNP